MAEEVHIPDGDIADIQQSYKYLWLLQANGHHKEATSK